MSAELDATGACAEGNGAPGASEADARAALAANGARAAPDDEWRTSGSAYLGRAVRRSIFDGAGALVGFSNGTVRGWLDAHESDFSDERGAPAALYHVVF